MLLDAHISARYANTQVLRDLTLSIAEGELVGLAGQSGSGKSTLALALMRLLQGNTAITTGSLKLEGREILTAPEREWRAIRGRRVALVMQGAESALNPALRLGRQLRLAWEIHATDWRATGLPQARSLFARCGLPSEDSFLDRYPAQISIGQAQRVLISMALLHRPALLIADEITSALDLLTQQEVLETLREVNRAFGMAILFVSHDLIALRSLCTRVAILSAGEIIENRPTRELFEDPLEPYTIKLLAALHRYEGNSHRESSPLSA